MNKKDYEAIAAVIRGSLAFYGTSARAAFILEMEEVLRADNPKNWNSRLWHEACRPAPCGVLTKGKK